ncbi:MAG TPA: DUF2207 domain-containing protein, partial [Desulfobulbus sp.]|nr:DUF2207 domain-containing protein [Desulfobulbus sp.]
MRRTLLPALLLVLLCAAVSASARTLYWQDMSVRARLDDRGTLHVREIQTMVFTGAWNGGERRFRLRPGQHLSLKGVFRRDPATGRAVPLIHGSLDQVDHWSWAGSHILRWRSRLPSDPPFANTAITYLIDYSITNILVSRQGRYLLSHDFCFPDRPGVVRNFTLDLELDPVWQSTAGRLIHQEARDIAPGRGVVLNRFLNYTGPSPEKVRLARVQAPKRQSLAGDLFAGNHSAPAWFRFLLLAAAWLFLAFRLVLFIGHERRQQRFRPMIPAQRIDRAWLSEHLFSMLPEVVGATWDQETGSSEVSAILARLIQEGKLESRVEEKTYHLLGLRIPVIRGTPILHLTLLVPRTDLSGYERKLIDELFIGDGTTTDTETLRKHYRKSGSGIFNPVERIRDPLKKKAKELTDGNLQSLSWIWVPSALFAVTGFFLFFADSFLHTDEFVPGIVLLFSLLACFVIALILALRYRRAVDHLPWRIVLFLVPLILALIQFSSLLVVPSRGSILLLLAFFFFCLALVNNVLNMARTRDSVEGVRLRRQLGAARRYF